MLSLNYVVLATLLYGSLATAQREVVFNCANIPRKMLQYSHRQS